MDKRSRIILIILLITTLGSIAATYWTTMHEKNFVIINDVEEEDMETEEDQ